MKIEELHHILPYKAFEEKDSSGNIINALILKDGRICFLFHVDGVEYEGWGPDEYKRAVQIMESSFRELPMNVTLQKTDIYYKEPNNMQSQVKSYVDEQRCKHFNKRASLRHKSYIALSFAHEDKASKVASHSTMTAKKGQFIPKWAFKDIWERLTVAVSRTNSWYSQMSQLPGVEFKKMDENEIKTVIYQYMNLEWRDIDHEVHDMIQNNHDSIKIGHKLVNVISLIGQSEELYSFGTKDYFGSSFYNPWANVLHFDLQIPHIVNTVITKVPIAKALKDYKMESLINNQLSSNSPMGKKSSVRGAILDEQIALIEQRKDGFVEFSMNIILFSDNQNELRRYREMTETAIKSMSMAKYLNESYDAQNIFFAGLPGNGFDNVRSMKMPTTNALPYYQFMKPYISDENGELLTDRFGVPVRVDLCRPDLTSKNRMLFGPTGSGKSFTQGSFICTADEREEIQVIIDKGGTYKQLMQSLGGVYMEHTPERPMKFNPFEIEKNDDGTYLLTQEKTVVLVTFITLLWKSKEQGEFLNNAESTFLLRWIEQYYEGINNNIRDTAKDIKATLKGFTEFIISYDDEKRTSNDKKYLESVEFFNVRHFTTVMQPYTDGIYKDVFNNPKAMNLADNKLICFDLEGIQKDPKLYPIVTMLVIDLVLSHIAKFPNVIKHVILDEAWSFFTGDMAEFILYMYRTIRKHNGTATIITQSAQDILNSDLKDALIQNTQVYVVLDHTGKPTEPLKRVGISDINVKKIETIRKNWTIDDGYGNKVRAGREVFIQREDKSLNVYAMEVPIEQYVLLTSMPEERNHFQFLLKDNEIDLAIEIWKQDKEKGKINKETLMVNDFISLLRNHGIDEAYQKWKNN